MSTTEDVTTEDAAPPAAEHHEGEVTSAHHEHPSDWLYVKVAIFLAILTALEVSTYGLNDPSTTLLVAILFPMMIIKFGTVIMYFMHLKYDNPIFKRVFLFGLGLAVIVFLVTLTTFDYWNDDFLKFLH
jgi:cytochrome c oxidase subunit 4